MRKPELNLNKHQILGCVFLIAAIFTALGGLSWVMAYWDTQLEETYRGFDVYYFPNIKVWGIDTGGEPMTWPTGSPIDSCRNRIDGWLDEPALIEQHRDFTVYRLNGYGLYYAEGLSVTTTYWDNATNLEAYLDAEYYETLVYTIHRDGVTWMIYRQGYDDPVYWGESGGESTPQFTALADAKQHIYDLLDSEDVDETSEAGETADTADEVSGEPEGGGTTLGDMLAANQLMITGFSGALGVGLVLYGSTREDDEG